MLTGAWGEQGSPVDIAALESRATDGDLEAQYQLGFAYLWGEGVERDVHRAAKLLYASAKGGYAKAYAPLGECYLHGMGVKLNIRRARNCFGTGAKLGDAAAQMAPSVPRIRCAARLSIDLTATHVPPPAAAV